MAKFTIKVTATLNGKTCKNPQIEFIQGEDFLYPCEIKDGEITFEIKPGTNPNACVEGYIKCEDECLNCPPQYFKKCLCNDVTLLEACQKCVDGFIVDTCTPAQIAMGMICTPDGCQCPPSSPIKDPNTGQCVQCITGTVSGCKICVAGHWEDIVCPTGERCDNGVCKCPPGYIRDPFTGLCIVTPSCDEDSDCGLCEICVSGNCVPLVCPEGYKCVDGECVYWPCTNTNCTNGADCGEGCGCLNGVCTPCYLLDCANPTGLSIYPACVAALGCKCSGVACVPVDNCGQPCDGFTPCTEPGCTCYNGTCVNCANFPCTAGEGGCDSYYNCQCTNGNCEGGPPNDGCKDKLEIKQECGSNDNDCKLIAELTAKGCKCDPIRFETINKDICTPNPVIANTVTNLGLEVKLYKGTVLYSDFGSLAIGDNEFVSGNIQTVVTHYDVNNNIISSIAVTPVADKAISGNAVTGNIVVSQGTHYKRTYTATELGQTVTKGTLVKVEVFAKNIEIVNNDCVNYDDALIATYELNFRTTPDLLNTCGRNTLVYAQTAQTQEVVDNVSTKRPLFIWSKGITDFKTTAYVNNKVYDQSGWFRKAYGVKSGSVWKDTISKFTEPEELWNNYNYQVKVDCGCATVANKNKVLFCCLPEFDYEFSNCNKKLIIQPFNVCNVNGKIDSFAPINSQTNYYVRLTLKNGAERNILIPFDTNTKTITFTYDQPDDESIVSAVIFQSYQGGLLTPFECPKDLTVPEAADVNVTYTRDCGVSNPANGVQSVKVTVPQPSGAVKIKKIEFYRNLNGSTTLSNFNIGLNNSPSDISNQPSYVTYLPSSQIVVTLMSVVMRVFFSNGCSKDIRIQNCQPSVTPTPNPGVSTLNCDNGIGAAITAVTEGFDTTQTINYGLEGGNLPQPIENTTGVFSNLAAGDYILTATQGETTVSVPATVIEVNNPDVILVPSTICPGQTATLTITALSGTAFTVTGPNGLIIANPVISNSGVYNVTNLTAPGNYTVTLTSDPASAYCPQFTEVEVLATGGQALTPIIETQPGSYCVGQPIPFRIRDNGAGATYSLSSNGSGSLPATLQSSETTYNGSYVPNSTSGIIRITGVSDTCNTTTTPQISVTALANPVISNAVSSCANDNTNTVTVTTTGATGVTVEGVAAVETPPASGIYIRSSITGLTDVDIVVTNGACNTTQNLVLGNCACPTGELFITSTGDTCGQGNTTIQFNGDTLGIDGTWFYVFQQMSGPDYIDLNVPTFFPPVPLSPAPTTVISTSIGEVKSARLKAINPTNGCEYFSAPVSFTAVQPPIGSTITPSVQLPVLTGVPISFSTQAGYFSYVWSGDVAGTTNTSTPKIFNTPGTYQATVTVCSAVGCCEVISLTFDVEQACTPAILFGSPSSGLCSDITIAATGGNGAKTYEIFGTYINVASTAVPGSNIITIPTAAVPQGASDSLLITVTDANGCIANTTVPYTRCSCICDTGNVCNNILTAPVIVSGTRTIKVPNDDVYIRFQPGGYPDRIAVKNSDNTVTYVDTYQVGTSTATGLYNINNSPTNAYQSFDLDLVNADAGQTGVAVGASIAGLRTVTGTNCTTLVSAPTANDATFFPTILAGVSAIRGTDNGIDKVILIKIPQAQLADTELNITYTPYNDERCGGVPNQGNQALYEVSCSPFDLILLP